MQQFGTSVFHMVVRWHKWSEVENKSTLHNSIILAICMPKIIKVSKNLTKLWKNNLDCFLNTVYRVRQKSGPLKSFAVFSVTVWNFSS